MTPYYEHGGIVIYHGDCRDVLLSLSPVDLLLTDPPYGISEAAGKNRRRGGWVSGGLMGGRGRFAGRDFGAAEWDQRTAPDAIRSARQLCRWAAIFGGNFYELPPSRCWLVWDKDNGSTDFADCELVWTNFHHAVRKITYRWNGMLQEPGCPREGREHPTQKPEPVIRWALLQAPSNVQSVLDPFMGSGTTLVAAKRLGRQAIGIEIEERYCEIAAKRLAQEILPFEARDAR